MKTTTALVIGAGPAGLAAAARLRKAGIPFLILEKEGQVGSAWRRHYDRLHLHTAKSHSSLPYFKFPADIPKYPSRQQVVDYLELYCEKLGIEPIFDQEVQLAEFKGGVWGIRTADQSYRARFLVVACGLTRIPRVPDFPGLDGFPGTVIHSRKYKNSKPFSGKKVLVVGFGNSAGEIAMDLHEGGATSALAVRSPVNIIPRDVGPFNAVALGIYTGAILPDKFLDANSRRIARQKYGDIEKLGLKLADLGPKQGLLQKGRVTLIDFGLMKYVMEQKIRIFPGLDRIEGNRVFFSDGRSEEFDAIILGTGYRPDLSFLPEFDPGESYSQACPPQIVGESKNLYFAGFQNQPGGAFRGMGIDAKKIVADIRRQLRDKSF